MFDIRHARVDKLFTHIDLIKMYFTQKSSIYFWDKPRTDIWHFHLQKEVVNLILYIKRLIKVKGHLPSGPVLLCTSWPRQWAVFDVILSWINSYFYIEPSNLLRDCIENNSLPRTERALEFGRVNGLPWKIDPPRKHDNHCKLSSIVRPLQVKCVLVCVYYTVPSTL